MRQSYQGDQSYVNTLLHGFVYVISFSIFAYAAYLTRDSTSGDAAIYFTFFKNFFDLPFSFQPGIISQGATSPLHVLIFAPIHQIFGSHWLVAAKILNFGFVFGALLILQRGLKLSVLVFPLFVGLVTSYSVLMCSTSELFETGIIFLAISCLLFFLLRDMRYSAIIVAGVLHLVRPELILITLAIYSAFLFKFRKLRHFIVMCLMGIIVLVYYIYMVANGAGWLPSSVVGRGLASIEQNQPWIVRFGETLNYLDMSFGNPYVFCLIAFCVYVVYKKLVLKESPLFEMLIVLPVLLLYSVMPPGHYIQRYLIPIIPVISFSLIFLIWKIIPLLLPPAAEQPHSIFVPRSLRLLAAGASTIIAVFVVSHYAPWERGFYNITQEEVLLPKLADIINTIASQSDNILLYEIQGQYYMKARAIGITVVGNQATDFLLRREGFEKFMTRERIKYIVTMNSFNYRKLYDNTPLKDLYIHDLLNPVGTSLDLNGVSYKKIVTNPDFSDPKIYRVHTFNSQMNYDNKLRLFGPGTHRVGTHLPWNSIYKVTFKNGEIE